MDFASIGSTKLVGLGMGDPATLEERYDGVLPIREALRQWEASEAG